jgi:hypothetical protein
VAARALPAKATAKLVQRVAEWPPNSPAAANAWLLLVTTKPPSWRDPLFEWVERPLSMGSMHEGFLYPDPRGFWDEVRRWVVQLLRTREPAWGASESLAIAALVHVGEATKPLDLAMTTCRPGVVLFLDEPAWQSSGWEVDATRHHVPDPHRDGQVYQGFWGRRPDDVIVGKAPQHPSAHSFYRSADMDGFLRALPAD